MTAGRGDRPHTFVFADLAGYTAFTEARGDEAAARTAAEFATLSRRLAADHDAHFVKSMGDGVLLAAHVSASAICLGLHLAEELGARPGSTAIRVGMHTGSAIGQDADWYGAAVNLAARVGALAQPGQVLVTAATLDDAGPLRALRVTDLGVRRMRHVRAGVRLYAIQTNDTPAAQLVIDPVCHAIVDPATTRHVIERDGERHVLCSRACADRFGS